MAYTDPRIIIRRSAMADQLRNQERNSKTGVLGGIAHLVRNWGAMKGGQGAEQALTENDRIKKREMSTMAELVGRGGARPEAVAGATQVPGLDGNPIATIEGYSGLNFETPEAQQMLIDSTTQRSASDLAYNRGLDQEKRSYEQAKETAKNLANSQQALAQLPLTPVQQMQKIEQTRAANELTDKDMFSMVSTLYNMGINVEPILRELETRMGANQLPVPGQVTENPNSTPTSPSQVTENPNSQQTSNKMTISPNQSIPLSTEERSSIQTDSDGNSFLPYSKASVERRDELNKSRPQAKIGLIKVQSEMAKFVEKVEKLRDHKGLPRILGMQGQFLNMPGGDASNAQALVDNLNANNVLAAMSELKASSSNGSTGFGSLTGGEMKVLETYIASLDRNQSVDQFKGQLNEIIDWATDNSVRFENAFYTEYGGKQEGNLNSAPGNGLPVVDLDELMNKYR